MSLRSSGCWTCRIRHRKCDSQIPICKECTDRNIQCHGYGRKPDWMDGAAEEEKEKSKIRQAVKENFRKLRRMQNQARHRRRTFREQPHEATVHEEWTSGGMANWIHEGDNNLFPHVVGNRDFVSISSVDASDSPSSNPQSAHTGVTRQGPEKKMADIDAHDASLIMHYLDQVFSWQFPYHSCASRLGNRGWLLLLLVQRGPLYHAVLSLSSVHQSALLGQDEEYYQQSIAFDRHSRALRELCAFMSCKEDELLSNSARLTEFLSSSVMLITFEVFRGGEHDWQLHLNALTSLLSQFSPAYISTPQVSHGIAKPGDVREYFTSSSSKDYHGLRFLITAALWFDILSCVSTGKAPALPYNTWLNIPGLDMADLMGCQNWVMVAIGNLASLKDWKDDRMEMGLLSTRELALKGQQIEKSLEAGIEHLDSNAEGLTDGEVNVFWVSRIFALAALVLLHSIVSEPQPKLPEIQSVVWRTIDALQARPKSCPANGIIWALCVTSSMAQPAARHFFERFLDDMLVAHGKFGNCSTALRVIKKCWELQQHGPADCRAAMSELGICAIFI